MCLAGTEEHTTFRGEFFFLLFEVFIPDLDLKTGEFCALIDNRQRGPYFTAVAVIVQCFSVQYYPTALICTGAVVLTQVSLFLCQ